MKALAKVQWSGIALTAAGFLWLASSLIHPSDYDPDALSNPLWVPNAVLILLAYALVSLALFALPPWVMQSPARWTRLGLTLAAIGSAASALTSFVFGFVAPAVARQQGQPTSLFDLIGPGGPMLWAGALLSTYVVLFLPGFILTGLYLFRLSRRTRWPGALLILGVVLFSLGRMVAPLFPLTAIGGVVFAAALVGWGLVLFTQRNPAPSSSAAI